MLERVSGGDAKFQGFCDRWNKWEGQLRRLFEDGKASGLPASFADKIDKILGFLQDMESAEELQAIPTWKAHQLGGDRKGTWSLFVSKNWRITFRIDETEVEIIDLDYEDYH